MSAHPDFRAVLPFVSLACGMLASCASTSHVTAFQERQIAAAPRSLGLALDRGESLPFGIAPNTIATAAAKAGFMMEASAPRYRLAITAAAGAADAGSYLPATGSGTQSWVARPDRHWRARFAGGRVLRVTAILIDSDDNREVWRGTGTLRTSDPQQAAAQLANEVLAKLPKS